MGEMLRFVSLLYWFLYKRTKLQYVQMLTTTSSKWHMKNSENSDMIELYIKILNNKYDSCVNLNLEQ